MGSGAQVPADLIEKGDRRRAVLDALAVLPTPQRVAIELARYGGLSQSQIAQRLNQPLGTIQTQIRLGMLKLLEALQATQSD